MNISILIKEKTPISSGKCPNCYDAVPNTSGCLTLIRIKPCSGQCTEKRRYGEDQLNKLEKLLR